MQIVAVREPLVLIIEWADGRTWWREEKRFALDEKMRRSSSSFGDIGTRTLPLSRRASRPFQTLFVAASNGEDPLLIFSEERGEKRAEAAGQIKGQSAERKLNQSIFRLSTLFFFLSFDLSPPPKNIKN